MTYATCQACGKQCATWGFYLRHLDLQPKCRAIADESATWRAENAK
jgi:hypothetical protein